MSHPRLPSSVLQIIRDRPLTSFFVLAYTISWLLWTPVLILGVPVFSASTHTPSLWILPGIAFGVTGSAFAVTALTEGRPGVQQLLRRLVLWRVGWRWYAVAVLLIPVSEVAVTAALGGPDALRAFTPAALLLYPAAYLAHFFFGPLFEESGWRGFALPRMQDRFGPLRASLPAGLALECLALLSVCARVVFGRCHQRSGRCRHLHGNHDGDDVHLHLAVQQFAASLLLAILLHGSVDGTATYLQVLGDREIISADSAAFAVQFGVLIACVLWALVLTAVTRGRLGMSG